MRFDFSSFRRASAIALAGLLALGAAACDDWFTDPGSDEDRFLFSVREAFPWGEVTGDRTPVTLIWIRTVRDYSPCARLQGTVEREDRAITVTIGGFYRVDYCDAINATAGPVTFAEPVPLDEGEYTLRIRRGRYTDTHRVLVGADKIEVVEGSRDAARAEYTRYWRFPRPSLAIYCWADVGRSLDCAGVRNRIAEKAGLIPVTFPPGDGIPFSEFLPIGSYTIHRYAGEEDFDAVKEALTEAAREYPSVQPVIIDWRNRWVYPAR
jgi:hypothetical protein